MNIINNKIPQGSTALITGGSSGIGKEFSRQLAANGVNLILVSNQEQELRLTSSEIEHDYDVSVSYLHIDLSTPNAATHILNWCTENNLIVDILINNAGIFAFKALIEMSQERINLFIDLHIRAVTELCHIFGSEMAKRNHGYILNMSSMSCWMPMPGISMYGATKAYIRVLSRAIQLELSDSGVSVTVACPGGIATDLFGLPKNLQQLGVKLGVLVTPQKFVRGALKATFAKKKQYINGFINRFSIVFVAMLPSKIRLIVKHKLLDK